MMRYAVWALLLFLSAPVKAGATQEVMGCLNRYDVACAAEHLAEIDVQASSSSKVWRVAAEVAFYQGQYDLAAQQLARAVELGDQDPYGDLPLYERTRDVLSSYEELSFENFTVRYRAGMDAVIADRAGSVAALARKNLVPLLIGAPVAMTPIEIFPDANSFIQCSSLTEDNVRTTGVVALSKWSRLLLTSPRALGRGYGWMDTLAHEYIHLIVAYQTEDKAPVWLQEAIAKYLDNRWRDGRDHFRLSRQAQALLAKGLADEDLVSFDEMHPSLAKLPSAERASLAYAQLSTLMAYAFKRGGEQVLLRALPLIRDDVDPREALAQGAGLSSFAQLEADWRQWLEQTELYAEPILMLPTVVDGAEAIELDPILSQRQDLARFMRLGDLLQARSHHKAALVEYEKAYVDGKSDSPLLSNRVASVYLAMKKTKTAESLLRASLLDYPEFSLSYKTLGAILVKQGRKTDALKAYQQAEALYPYDPQVQRALVSLYAALGDGAGKRRHERYLRILQRGGEG